MGHNRLTSWALSQGFFAPLAKLSYGAYLVHPIFIIFNAYNAPGGEYFTINREIVNYLAWVIVAYTVSFILWMLIEAPCLNLESMFIFNRANKKQKGNKQTEALLKHLEDKIAVIDQDCENRIDRTPNLFVDDKEELLSNNDDANDFNIKSDAPLLIKSLQRRPNQN